MTVVGSLILVVDLLAIHLRQCNNEYVDCERECMREIGRERERETHKTSRFLMMLSPPIYVTAWKSASICKLKLHKIKLMI